MNKRVIAFVSMLSISISLPTIPVNAGVKEGTACAKAGITLVASSKTYTCIKSGKKLVWKLNSQNSNTSKPLTPTTNLSDAALFSNLDKCKIIDGDPQTTNMTAGFPIPDGRIDLIKGAKIQIIGVDFPDKIGGTKSPKDLNQNLTSSVEKFWTAQSTNPVKFEWNWSADWVRMPNSINSYSLGGSFFQGLFNDKAYFSFAREIISKTDLGIDFTGVNFLFIVFPPGVRNEEIGTFLVHTQGTYSTSEGNIFNLIMAGGDYNSASTYIHEFGHALGLTDIRDTLDVGNQKSDGMYYDVMNNSTYPELLVWHRFLLGFLENSQIHCINSTEASTHWLVPVEKDSKQVKGVVIPLSSTEAVIVESRRGIGFDIVLAARPDLVGAVVYTLDSKIPYRRTPVKVVRVLKNNDSVNVAGYKISLVESGDFGDVIKVEKAA
jgi:M6 family metalloprotease-like protein